jgi:hypothetical protein
MRVFGTGVAVLLVVFVGASQVPVTNAAQARSSRPATGRASSTPDGDLAQLMRGILFPSSNLVFDVQQNDPGAPPKKADAGSGASHDFSNVYNGWQIVEAAAVALEESADLILKPGRSCSNGKPAPVGRPDYVKFAQELREAGRKSLAAAKEKSQEKVSDSTNDLSEACSHCHDVYRKGPAGSPTRCTP